MEARHSPSGVDLRGISPRAVVVACVTAGALVAVGLLLWRAPVAILLTLIATLLAVALDHPCRILVSRHVRRGLAVAAITLSGLLLLIGVGLLLVPPAVSQIEQLVRATPQLLARLTHSTLYARVDRWIDIGSAVSRLQERVAAQPTQLAAGAFSVASRTLAVVVAAVTVLFLTLFMLLYGRSLIDGALGLLPPARRARVADALGNIYRVLGWYMLGLAGVCAINGTAATLLLAVLGVPFFLPLGVFSGFSSIIPVVGATLAGALLTLTTWAARGPWYALGVALFFIAYQQIENHIIGPLVYKRTVQLNPLASMLAFLFAADLWGIAGAVLAVPVLATAQVVIGELRGARTRRALAGPDEG